MFKNGLALPIVLGFAMAVTGCGGDKDGDSAGDTSTTTGATGGGATGGETGGTGGGGAMMVDSFDAACTGADWIYSAHVVNGWTGDAVVNAWEVLPSAAGYDEEHTMPSVDFGADEAWDDIERTLTQGAYVPDSSTLFACGTHDLGATPFNDAMVFAYRVYDLDLNLADCVIYGSLAADVLAGGGDVTGYNTLSNPTELDGCTDATDW
jgi:hypothetical protein